MVQKFEFYAHKGSAGGAAVSINFAVASVCLLHTSTEMPTNFSLLSIFSSPLVFSVAVVLLQSIIPASFCLGLLGKFSSIKQLTMPARCLYCFIY